MNAKAKKHVLGNSNPAVEFAAMAGDLEAVQIFEANPPQILFGKSCRIVPPLLAQGGSVAEYIAVFRMVNEHKPKSKKK